MQWEMICVDKWETFKLEWGLNLLEIMYCPAEGRGMAVLLAVRGGSHEAFGRWAGNRIVLLGMPRPPEREGSASSSLVVLAEGVA
jgi:hypothetical protein